MLASQFVTFLAGLFWLTFAVLYPTVFPPANGWKYTNTIADICFVIIGLLLVVIAFDSPTREKILKSKEPFRDIRRVIGCRAKSETDTDVWMAFGFGIGDTTHKNSHVFLVFDDKTGEVEPLEISDWRIEYKVFPADEGPSRIATSDWTYNIKKEFWFSKKILKEEPVYTHYTVFINENELEHFSI